MPTIAFGSVRSCGVTTTVAALAALWPQNRARIVVELDDAGGTLAAMCGLGPSPGLLTLAAASRRGATPDLIWEHCQTLSDGTPVVVAPPSPGHVRSALPVLREPLAQFQNAEADILIDCGRLHPESPSLPTFERAAVAIVAVRPQLPDLHCLASLTRSDDPMPEHVSVILVGAGPYAAREVSRTCAVDVLGEVPFDPALVDALHRGDLAATSLRSPLVRRLAVLSSAVLDRLRASERADRRSQCDQTRPEGQLPVEPGL